MIPKKIHYCWLSGEKMPKNIVKCMNTWAKVMPDYEVVLWDMNKFDIHSVPFVEQACSARKWAFAADYIRLYAVYTEGGIYFDSDVCVKKSFDTFLQHDFFTAIDVCNGFTVQAAIFGGIKGHSFLKSCMEWYENNNFIMENKIIPINLTAPCIQTSIMENYGFQHIDKLQKLNEGIVIYPSDVLACTVFHANNESFAIHVSNTFWVDKSKFAYIRRKIHRILVTNKWIRKIWGKKKLVYEASFFR